MGQRRRRVSDFFHMSLETLGSAETLTTGACQFSAKLEVRAEGEIFVKLGVAFTAGIALFLVTYGEMLS